MAVRLVNEDFGNSGSTKPSTNNEPTVLGVASKMKFDTKDASEQSGLVIGPGGMVAVEYDLKGGKVIIRPDNDLELDSRSLAKFKNDLDLASKLASQIYDIINK